VTFGFRPDGTPDGSYASVPAGAGSVYVATKLTGLSVGQKVHAIVTDAWGNEVAKPEVVIDPGAADRWLALPVPLPAELAPGEYGVFIFADDHPLGSLAFGVTGVGTCATAARDAGESSSAEHRAAAWRGAGGRTTDSRRRSRGSDGCPFWLIRNWYTMTGPMLVAPTYEGPYNRAHEADAPGRDDWIRT